MKKILIIDDDRNFVVLLSRRLQTRHCNVISALSGSEGIEKVKSEMPDLIILDLKMPETDGFTVMSVLQQTPRVRDIPVIILTGFMTNQNIEIARKIGIADYIEKRADLNPIVERIHSFLTLMEEHQPLGNHA